MEVGLFLKSNYATANNTPIIRTITKNPKIPKINPAIAKPLPLLPFIVLDRPIADNIIAAKRNAIESPRIGKIQPSTPVAKPIIENTSQSPLFNLE